MSDGPTLRHSPSLTLHTAMYTAHASGQDGFFSLALTPNQGLRQPVVRITGVPTYQIVPTRLPNVKAYQVITVCGRYKGHVGSAGGHKNCALLRRMGLWREGSRREKQVFKREDQSVRFEFNIVWMLKAFRQDAMEPLRFGKPTVRLPEVPDR